jgi:hypothetical protein
MAQIETKYYTDIINYVNKRFYEDHIASITDDIVKETKLTRSKASIYISKLVSNKKLYELYSGKGKATIYIPYEAMFGLLKNQSKPKWLSSYIHSEKSKFEENYSRVKKEYDYYQSLEDILYATDRSLERAISLCLEFVEFDRVLHLDSDDSHDVEFNHQGKVYIIEAKGKTKYADKDDVLQLNSWIGKIIENGGKADNTKGILFINHYRLDNPSNRKEPLSSKAIEFLKLYNFKYITTFYLHKIISNFIDGKLTREQLKEKIINGQKL